LSFELNEALKKAETKIGIEDIEPIEAEIKTFCEIIDDINPIYLKQKVFPPGYIMNLTNRVIQKVFIEIGPLFISRIRGLIHVGSEVDFFRPMPLKKKYKIKIETSIPVEKKGKMGNYYSVIFKTLIFDEDENLYAVDHHNFFFKL